MLEIFAADSQGGGSSLPMWGLTALLIVAVYFLMIRPQQKRKREMEAMQSSVGPGAEVVTIGGLYGTVVEVSDDSVTLEVAPGVTNRYVRGAISRVVTSTATPEETGTDEAEESDSSTSLSKTEKKIVDSD